MIVAYSLGTGGYDTGISGIKLRNILIDSGLDDIILLLPLSALIFPPLSALFLALTYPTSTPTMACKRWQLITYQPITLVPTQPL